MTKNVLVFVDFGTPFGLECLNRAKEIVLRDNKKAAYAREAFPIAPEPHKLISNEVNPEFLIFQRKVGYNKQFIKSMKLVNSHNEFFYTYLIIVRTLPTGNFDYINNLIRESIESNNPALLSTISNEDLASAFITWPRILNVSTLKPTSIYLTLCNTNGSISTHHVSHKYDISPSVILLARSAKKGGLWPIPNALPSTSKITVS